MARYSQKTVDKAFNLYIEMGSDRTVEKVADQLKIPVNTVRAWCRISKWVDKAKHREMDEANAVLARIPIENAKEARERQIRLGKVMQHVGMTAIKDLRGKIKTIGDAQKLVSAGVKIENEARADEKSNIHIDRLQIIENPLAVLEKAQRMLDSEVSKLGFNPSTGTIIKGQVTAIAEGEEAVLPVNNRSGDSGSGEAGDLEDTTWSDLQRPSVHEGHTARSPETEIPGSSGESETGGSDVEVSEAGDREVQKDDGEQYGNGVCVLGGSKPRRRRSVCKGRALGDGSETGGEMSQLPQEPTDMATADTGETTGSAEQGEL